MWHLAPHQSSVFLMIATHETGHLCLGPSLLFLLGQICHLWPCLPKLVPVRHVWGGVIPPSSAEITCISKQYQVPGWSGVGFLTGDRDGEHDVVLPNASVSSGPCWLLSGVKVWPPIWILAPVFWLSKLLDLMAVDSETVAVNWNSGQVHSVQALRPMQEN